jgi:putative transposase
MRIREIAETRVRYGYRRVQVLLRREGWRVNHKRTYRIYCQEGLNLRRKHPRRHVTGSRRMARPVVERLNACWSMDFVVDSLFNGHRFRALTIVDNFSRESLAIEAGQIDRAVDLLKRKGGKVSSIPSFAGPGGKRPCRVCLGIKGHHENRETNMPENNRPLAEALLYPHFGIL